MTLRRALVLYLLVLHALFAAGGAFLLLRYHRPWILLLEVLLLASLGFSYFILRGLRIPSEIVSIGTEWLREGDLAHSFRPTGLNDVDSLAKLYNEMVARLRDERIRQEEQDVFLHKVLTASPSGIISTDHDGQICLVNPAAARLLGMSEEELCGHRPGDLDSSVARFLAAVPTGEARLLAQRGRRRLRCTHSQFFDRGFPRDFFVIEDLTHELWETEKHAYDSLIRTLSHEVNNTVGATDSILHSALTYGDQLRKEDHHDFSSALRVAIERMHHLNAFMHRYAEVARVPRPTKRPTDVVDMLRRICRLMEPECRKREVRLNLSVEQSARPVMMDVAQMEQVFVNVIRNALEAIQREGSIDIRVGPQDGRTMVVVEDSGPGLTPEAQANLFTPFFSTKPQGQGVGLTLVREILTLHGFDFSLESPPGDRTQFRITLEK